jgi:hypothetical protein
MNDLELIKELAPDERLPGVGELASARGRLAAAIATEVPDGAAQRTVRQTRRASDRGGQPGGLYSSVSPRRPSPRAWRRR